MKFRAMSCLHSSPTRRSSDLYLRVVEEQGRYVASLPEMAQPTPARGEVLIRVTASGVNRAVTRMRDRKSTRLNSSHRTRSYAVFCVKKKHRCRTRRLA